MVTKKHSLAHKRKWMLKDKEKRWSKTKVEDQTSGRNPYTKPPKITVNNLPLVINDDTE